ncbi:hypothetical protein [Leptospira neocaledonica]|uniref:Lipoprotein n=1 Tax=Leptospira neocaledonica TaxID=2023192 RepID=A0A2M9ZW88_9LEPT|nr:hypothetical protein [Leptospira neocaledonica]PJZ76307.1 hypothetical protein CH365_13005 [Leptospira neocaledonica]
MKYLISLLQIFIFSIGCTFTKVYPKSETIYSSDIIESKASEEIRDLYLLSYDIKKENIDFSLNAYRGKKEFVEGKVKEIFRTFYGVRWKSKEESGLESIKISGGTRPFDALAIGAIVVTGVVIVLTVDIATLPIRMYPVERERIINKIIHSKDSKLSDIDLKGYQLEIYNSDFSKRYRFNEGKSSIKIKDLNLSHETLTSTHYRIIAPKGNSVSEGGVTFSEDVINEDTLKKILAFNYENNLINRCKKDYRSSLNDSLFKNEIENSKFQELCKVESNPDGKEILDFCKCYQVLYKYHHSG